MEGRAVAALQGQSVSRSPPLSGLGLSSRVPTALQGCGQLTCVSEQ